MPTLKIDTNRFCKIFDIQHPDNAELMYDGDIPDREIEEVLEDYNIEDTEENRQSVTEAIAWTFERDTGERLYEAWKDAVAEILDTFSDYKYEYFSEGEFKSHSGTAKGVLSYDIKPDVITIEVDDDFYHVINDCIAGYGLVDAQGDEPMDAEEMESTFSHLKYFWEIYGNRKPQVEGVDWEWTTKTFKEMLSEVGLRK